MKRKAKAAQVCVPEHLQCICFGTDYNSPANVAERCYLPQRKENSVPDLSEETKPKTACGE